MEGKGPRTERVCAIIIAIIAASITEVDNIRCSGVNVTTDVYEFVRRNWYYTGKAASNLRELWVQGSVLSPE